MSLVPLLFPISWALAEPAVHIRPPDLEATVIAAPRFADDPYLPPSRCLVRVDIDPTGVPIDTEARACPPRFVELAEAAVQRWRWSPPSVDRTPVYARTAVAVEFTGRGRLPVAPAERCTYALRVTADGRVTQVGGVAPQCAIWPAEALDGAVPAAGSCTVSVDAGIERDTPGWVVAESCPAAALEAAAVLAGSSLFVEGTLSTRLVLELPQKPPAPEVSEIEIERPSVTIPAVRGRIEGPSTARRALDPAWAAPERLRAPTVDLTNLRSRVGAEPESEPVLDADTNG